MNSIFEMKHYLIHFLEFSDSYNLDARMKLKDFIFEYFSSGVKFLIMASLDEIKLVVTEKLECGSDRNLKS